jgi:hypothetical protein
MMRRDELTMCSREGAAFGMLKSAFGFGGGAAKGGKDEL